jgi:hypothetical protein
MVLWFAAALGLAVAAIVAGRLRGVRPQDAAASTDRPPLGPASAVVGAAVMGALVPLSVFAPSPVVIGVLTVPLATLGALVLAAAAAHVPWARSRAMVGLLPLAAGLWIGGRALVVPPVWAAGELAMAQAHNELFERIAADPGGTIAWMTVSEGANWAAFSVHLYESGRAVMVGDFRHTETMLFAMDADAAQARIAEADGVVTWRHFPAEYPYPAIESLRDTQAQWQPLLDRDFTLRFEFAMPGGTIAYYHRVAPR